MCHAHLHRGGAGGAAEHCAAHDAVIRLYSVDAKKESFLATGASADSVKRGERCVAT